MEKNSIFYRLLGSHYFYSFSQKLMSATHFRKIIVTDFIKKKPSNILDIGCGPAEILKDIKNVYYYGFDVNKNYIEHAKKKYKYNAKFFCKNFSAKSINKKIKFDYVLLLGLLHHLNDKELILLLKEIKKVLKKNGSLLTLDNVYVNNQNFIAKKLIDLDRGENVRTKKEYLDLLKKHFKNVKSKIYHQTFIPYTWFVTKCFI
jgi:SAM-dependent methyltransferase